MDFILSINVLIGVLKLANCEPTHRTSYITESTGGECQTLQLAESWTSDTVLSCYVACRHKFPDTCQSVTYNPHTLSCTPGSTAFGPIDTLPSTIPDANSTDAIYVLNQPVPACNAGLGFAVYDVCGTSACLFIAAFPLTYADAAQTCADMGARLFIADSEARFSLFWEVSLNVLNQDTWVGLTDIAEEGQFVWENGNPLSTWQDTYLWMPFAGIPDNWLNGEHCVEAKHATWPGIFGLNDEECWELKYFICESTSA
ncbi:hypothetical protein EGW08_022054 [Elysia chlorotica]|uniref:C-type lectin domain-containing protein n=1 Tax=Elysia chlorotica TaxID=188477 RepID=A0A3S1BLZ0_ELYCH|nr:hypothetical protein EGW08_022054 [Elysia chlorotica]